MIKLNFLKDTITSSLAKDYFISVSELISTSTRVKSEISNVVYNFKESHKDYHYDSHSKSTVNLEGDFKTIKKTNEVSSKDFDYKNQEIVFNNEAHHPDLEGDAENLIDLLINSRFELGTLSPADKFFEKILHDKSLGYATLLLNAVGAKSYGLKKNTCYLHFLNIIKNASYNIKYFNLQTYAVCALSHKDCEVKDAGLSIFESFIFSNSSEIEEAIAILNNTDTTSYQWLDDYKVEIINDLTNSLQGKLHG